MVNLLDLSKYLNQSVASLGRGNLLQRTNNTEFLKRTFLRMMNRAKWPYSVFFKNLQIKIHAIFFLWGYMTSFVYSNQINTVKELQERMEIAVVNSPLLFLSVEKLFYLCFQYCIGNCHFLITI